MLIRKRGQSVLEYAILLVIIIAALIAMQTYIRRGIQGRLKSGTDDIGSQYSQNSDTDYYKRVQTNSRTRETTALGVTQTDLREPTITNSYEHIFTNARGEMWQ